ncbi:hypothetical protein QOZ80_8AG0621280 [Eleusine coracana subsp. coracana]|nr:hypothetical protein QOZ80_8AG0621280 [Eleusine coracana subsp. coracana]
MNDQTSEIELLQRIYIDVNANPIRISYGTIQHITKNFAQEIGTGGYGVVYLGALKNGMVAVKKLSLGPSMDFEQQFMDEVRNLMRVKHKNIVRFLGYCVDTQGELREIEGNLLMVDIPNRLLCFEYVPNGSLDYYLRDKTFRSYGWNTKYQIIRGICQALQYLHKNRMCHLDLKPANVLLGAYMEPKVIDFGLSRTFFEGQSKDFTSHVFGTVGYMAPELLGNHQISFKSDIYSLGVIMISLLTGQYGPRSTENWPESVLDVDNPMIKNCVQIAQMCVDKNPDNRPTIDQIIYNMNETETLIENDPPIIVELRNDPNSPFYQLVQRFQEGASETLGKSHSQGKAETTSHKSYRLDDIYMELDELESILEGITKPTKLSYKLLQFITGNFSDKRIIGNGGFSKIYKGIGSVAVKRLSWPHSSDELKFRQEVKSTSIAQHRNVVRFLGHCSYTEEKEVEYNGKIVPAAVLEKLLCFEYLSNGSLNHYLSDASRKVEWRERYQIIKGICEGLHFLHGKKIIHLDFKPDNILLDGNMVPKIADFGLARCFGVSQSQASTSNIGGTIGYMAPETFNQQITFKSDIFSLGVVISEILTGTKYFVIENVLEIWRTILQRSTADNLLDQVRVCAEISIACLDTEPSNRPDIQRIMEIIVEKECRDKFIRSGISVTSVVLQSEKARDELQQSSHNVPGDTNSEYEDDEGDQVLLRTDYLANGSTRSFH